MINLTIPDLKLLIELTGKGLFSDLKHTLHLKFSDELDELNVQLMCEKETDINDEIYFYYINYNDEYKFKTTGMLTTKNKNTYGCAEYEFNDCHYVDLGVRKCDVLNNGFLVSLKLARHLENERQAKMNTIKDEIK
jgi:hypothetical protein